MLAGVARIDYGRETTTMQAVFSGVIIQCRSTVGIQFVGHRSSTWVMVTRI